MHESYAKMFAGLPEDKQQALIRKLGSKTLDQLSRHWPFLARPNQRLPDGTDWIHWLILAGRGFGKTRTGAETTLQWALRYPGCRIAYVGPTAADVRDVMVQGDSGLEYCAYNAGIPIKYQTSNKAVKFPNGSLIKTFSAEEPQRLRGPQHHFYWVDELCAMPRARDTWDMLLMGLRLTKVRNGLVTPQGVITTTPRSTALLRELIKDPSVVISKGSTYENAENLAATYRQMLKDKYEGTSLGNQELHAEILEDASGAFWNKEMLADCRVDELPEDMFICIGVDPAVSATENSDLTGIVVVGMHEKKFYVIADHSGTYKPKEWASKVRELFLKYKADRVVAEINQGGDMVKELLVQEWGTEDIPFDGVRALVGKRARAEPISMLYEQGKVHHYSDGLELLEIELCTWDPLESRISPDRLDAMVWGLTELHKRCSIYNDITFNPSIGKIPSPWKY